MKKNYEKAVINKYETREAAKKVQDERKKKGSGNKGNNG